MMPFGLSVADAVKLLQPENPFTLLLAMSKLIKRALELLPFGMLLVRMLPLASGALFQRISSQEPLRSVNGGLLHTPQDGIMFVQAQMLIKSPKMTEILKNFRTLEVKRSVFIVMDMLFGIK